MAMKPTDRIHGDARGTADAVLGNLDRPEQIDRDYLAEVFRYAPIVTVDPAIVAAQWHLETGGGTSSRWRTNGNPAGLLVSQDGDPDPATWNGTEAARIHIWALLHACDPTVIPDWSFLPKSAAYFVQRWTAKYNDPRCPKVATIDDLNIRYADAAGQMQATWAWDETYQDGIVARSKVLFGDTLPDQKEPPPVTDVTFGRVPMPPCQIRDIPSSVNHAWDALGKRTVRAICWHRSLGSHRGNDAYFRGEGASSALTDYGVGVAAEDGADLAGVLYRWNDPRGDRSPWANGQVSNPYGDGKAFVDRYGIAAVNRDCTSIEISGFQGTPLDDAARESIAALTAYWADQYQVRWDTFPLIPAEANRSFVIWHQEFTIGTGKECPWQVVMGETDELIAQAELILKKWQTAAPKVVYPEKRVPIPMPGRVGYAGAPAVVVKTQSPDRFVCVHGTTLRTYPNRAAPKGVSKAAARNRTYRFGYHATVDGERWLASKSGSWALASAFELKP